MSVSAFPSPRRALPLLGEVPSAHTGERGLRGRTRSRREKTERSADNSFPYWQFLSHGDPSVSLTLDSSPKRGAKGVDESRRADLDNAAKRRRGLRGWTRSREEKRTHCRPFSTRYVNLSVLFGDSSSFRRALPTYAPAPLITQKTPMSPSELSYALMPSGGPYYTRP